MTSNDILLVLIGAVVAGTIGLISKIIFDWMKRPKYQTENGKPMLYMKCPLDRANAISDIQWIKENYGKEMDEYSKMALDVDWLKEVHSARDEDGVPLWYVPRSFGKGLQSIAEAEHKQTVTLERIADILSTNGIKLDILVKNGTGKK